MKPFKGFLVLVAFVIGYFLISHSLQSEVKVISVSVKPSSYVVDGVRVDLERVVELIKSYQGQGVEICLENTASRERLHAITQKIRDVEFRRKVFTHRDRCT